MRFAVLLAACGSRPPPPVTSPPPPIAIDAGRSDKGPIDPGIESTNDVDADKLDPGIHGGDPTTGLDPDKVDPGMAHRPAVAQSPSPNRTDKVMIRNTIKRHIAEIQGCYEKATNVDASIGIMTQFTIGRDGVVTSSSATLTAGGGDPQVANCIAVVIKGIVFSPPSSGGVVNVNYPFNFRRA